MYAIVETGGKQYRVKPGDTLAVEKLAGEPGEILDLDRVLLIAGNTDSETRVGSPGVAGAVVRAEVLAHFRGNKIIIFRYKSKVRYRRKTGHRQSLTRLRITDILVDGASSIPEPTAPEPYEEVEPEPTASSEPVATSTPPPVTVSEPVAQEPAPAGTPEAGHAASEPVATISAPQGNVPEPVAREEAPARTPEAADAASEPVATTSPPQGNVSEAVAEEPAPSGTPEAEAPTEDSNEAKTSPEQEK